MLVLAFDPGGRNGWAYHDEHKLIDFGNVPYKDLEDFLINFDREIDLIVCEDYKQLPGRYAKAAHTGQKFETLRAIGKVQFWAKMNKCKIVMRPSSDLPTAIKRTGIDPKKSGAHKDTHWAYAYVHGMNVLIRTGIAKSSLQKEKEK